jgi:hypothetical protein
LRFHGLLLGALALNNFPAFAITELYSWHVLDEIMPLHRKLDLVIHSRLRTRREFHSLQQVRGGPILRWKPAGRWTVIGGYYFQPAHDPGQEWNRGQRVFGGIERALTLKPVNLIGRLALERHINAGRPSYYRYRSYLRLNIPRGRISPFLQNEWLGVKQGFHSVRNSGGLRIRLTKRVTFEGGYLYDIRRTFWGGDRSAIVTAIQFRPGER